VRRAIGWLPSLHATALLLYLVVREIVTRDLPPQVPERAWWSVYNLVSLLNEFTPFFFVPLPLWVVTALIARTRAALLWAAVPWVIFAWLYGALFVPRPAHLAALLPPAAPEQTTLRVMTFNVLGVNRSPGDLADTILAAAPDVLLVQELSDRLSPSLDAALVGEYPHRRMRPTAQGRGAGIWSRYPIVLEEQWDRSRRGDRWQHAVVDVAGRRVHVVNLHLTAPALRWTGASFSPLPLFTGEVTQGRDNEVTDLVPLLRPLIEGPDPLIAGGDLNLTDQTPESRRLLAVGLRDAHRQVGWGFGHTFPSVRVARIFGRPVAVPVPLLRLDHILYSADVAPRAVRAGPAAGGSDHLPVLAELTLR
jgi:vancomycin resistance protein VanJ